MRKELKSKSRRKWLLGGSLAFASVALLTTGFATWVIGVTKTSGDGQVKIDVDTAEDKSVELTFKLDDDDNGIIVAEDAEKSSNDNLPIVKTVTPDWNIKIQDLNIAVGQEFYNQSLKGKTDLKIVFELQKNVAEDKNSVTKDEDKVGVRGETGLPWNYITLAKSEFGVTLPATYPADGRIYDINDESHKPDEKIFSFTWGSYFNREDPSVFYKKNEPTGGQSLREYYQNALQELQAMRTALTAAGTLTLTATFIYEK